MGQGLDRGKCKREDSLRHRYPASTTVFPRSIIFSATLRPSRQYLLRQLAGLYIINRDVVVLLIRHSNGDLVSQRAVAMTGRGNVPVPLQEGARAAEAESSKCIYRSAEMVSRSGGVSAMFPEFCYSSL
jgi:hypothetical protein